MDGSTLGWIGGISGGVLGLAGGVIGSYFSITRARGDAARAFMVKCVVIGWIAGFVFLAALLLLPSPWRYLVWLPYGVVFPLSLRMMNLRLAALESAAMDHVEHEEQETP
jgi:hypothetical protein